MKFTLVRHATSKIEINGVILLVDPMFSQKGTMDPVSNAPNEYRNPLVDLPFSLEAVLHGIDAVVLTHSHRDHYDDAAIELILKSTPIFCQPEDEDKLLTLGFSDVKAVHDTMLWNGISLTRTGGQHGTGELGKLMGTVSGFIMETAGEPSIYIAGDTVWCKEVEEAIEANNPEVIVLNGGKAQFLTGDPITMGETDIETVSRIAPASKIIVVHMESWNHCLLSRDELIRYIEVKQLSNIRVPMDGESMEL
jgi:L-ascorbate metabolism protein UlaG (beta-lactamase superfamily)